MTIHFKSLFVAILAATVLSGCITPHPSMIKANNLHTERKDFHILLSELTQVNQGRYLHTNSKGMQEADLERAALELEALYEKYHTPDLPDNKFSDKRLKVLMLFPLVAESTQSTVLNQALAIELLPLYQSNSEAFTNTLNQLPFLTRANCNRLNAYFNEPTKNAEMREHFIEANKALLSGKLDNQNYKQCIDEFR